MEAVARTLQGQEPMKIVKAPGVTVTANLDMEGPKMKAVAWHGKQDMRVVEQHRPLVTDPADAILRVTTACICGSDLHLYLAMMPGMERNDVMGHEFMGIVEDVGPEVRHLKKGDRVLTSFDIACGQCAQCKRSNFSTCLSTNPSKKQEKLYGGRTSGMFGYSHLTGGYQGGQAEYVRVPFADVNCLNVNNVKLPDERLVLLTDVLPTAWHANELGSVGPEDCVAIWGAGPVGTLAAQCAVVRGAKQVVLIDDVPYRLENARNKIRGIETINFAHEKVFERLHEIMPEGLDVGIEAVGLHYTHSLVQQLEMKLMLETDPSDTLNEIITCVRPGGRIAVVGVYADRANHFKIGAFMEKGLTMRAGQTPVQKYWPELLPRVVNGELDPTIVITHVLPLAEAPTAYKIFNEKKDNCIKVLLKPGMAAAPAGAD